METLETEILATLGIADPYGEWRGGRLEKGFAMSNTPLDEDAPPPSPEEKSEEDQSWFERLLGRLGIGEEPDLRELIEDALARAKSTGQSLSTQERTMLRNILRFGKMTVEDVMVPRADIIAVEDTSPSTR